MSNYIRPLAICVIQREGRILLMEGFDPVKQESFYRPLGGGIEFGETGAETVRREFMEEIQAGVGEVWYLGTLENIFTFNGKPGHEIVLVYDGRFVDESLYERDAIDGDDLGQKFRAVWKRLDELGATPPVYPTGLLDLLK
jgi:8-oxo-dGTP pyrophosphatase MutT (NUDIX family)